MEVKTKKLKKLWSKYQTAHREIKDIQEEFQQERSDMLDTIRELTRQLKLKEVGGWVCAPLVVVMLSLFSYWPTCLRSRIHNRFSFCNKRSIFSRILTTDDYHQQRPT